MEPEDPQDPDSFDFLFKIILIGDSNVGKTCLVQSFKSGLFSEAQQNTIGVDFTAATLSIDGRRVKMQVWDTAGQERFRTITQSYYRSAHGALITYDISRRDSFDSVRRWTHELRRFGAANVLTALIGNKRDLEAEREVLFSDACKLAEEQGMLAALETSARERRSVEEAFVLMARQLLQRNDPRVSPDAGPRPPLRPDSRPVLSAPPLADRERAQPCRC
ncbi:ras-related protein Rab-19-like [Puntigrus tetrazona]|uniref:ras-related protein Rab-19-like n=1 Tax=Puntigrus tetrazona TaxID=1606681 RepID=UPI001C89B2FE|nr:ras-related protein Rab-19-like [Puntigrus tetrazona]